MLAAEWLPQEIRVNAVSPGPLDTGILDKVFPTQEMRTKVEGHTVGIIPMKRFGTSDESQGRPLPRVRRDLHDRRRISKRRGLVATAKNKMSALKNKIAVVAGGSIGGNVTGVNTDISTLDDLDRPYEAVARKGKSDAIFAGAGVVESTMTAAAEPERMTI